MSPTTEETKHSVEVVGGPAAPPADLPTRSIERSIRIEAPPAAVWRALTEAEELVRWFPLEARVTPGVGGSIFMAWEQQYRFDTPIDVWEPQRRLRQIVPGTPVAIDFTLEPDGAGTVLRLVHSGFGTGEGWDGELDATGRGWRSELEGLRFYLERHAGEDRGVAWARVLVDAPREEQWRRITEGGMVLEDGALAAAVDGSRLSATLPGGRAITARVIRVEPPKEISLEVEEPFEGLLRVHLDDLPLRGVKDVHVWLTAYGVDAEELRRVRAEWVRRILAAFPGSRLPGEQPEADPSFGS